MIYEIPPLLFFYIASRQSSIMHEKLAQSIPLIDEKINVILTKLFENLEAKVQAENVRDITRRGVASDIKEVGEALNALATGLDNYRKVSREISRGITEDANSY